MTRLSAILALCLASSTASAALVGDDLVLADESRAGTISLYVSRTVEDAGQFKRLNVLMSGERGLLYEGPMYIDCKAATWGRTPQKQQDVNIVTLVGSAYVHACIERIGGGE